MNTIFSFSADDLHLLNEGRHYRAEEKFGTHRGNDQGLPGIWLAAWALNAAPVSVVGGFNGWHPSGKKCCRFQKN